MLARPRVCRSQANCSCARPLRLRVFVLGLYDLWALAHSYYKEGVSYCACPQERYATFFFSPSPHLPLRTCDCFVVFAMHDIMAFVVFVVMKYIYKYPLEIFSTLHAHFFVFMILWPSSGDVYGLCPHDVIIRCVVLSLHHRNSRYPQRYIIYM